MTNGMKALVKARAEPGLWMETRPLPEIGPGPGFTNLKWLKPVFPGDTLRHSCKVTGKRELNSRPQWGIVFSLNEGFNQKNELVFSFEGKVLTARR